MCLKHIDIIINYKELKQKHRWHNTSAWGPWAIWGCMNWFVKTAAALQAQTANWDHQTLCSSKHGGTGSEKSAGAESGQADGGGCSGSSPGTRGLFGQWFTMIFPSTNAAPKLVGPWSCHMSCILSSRSPKESNINVYKFRLLFFFCFSLVRLMPSAGCFASEPQNDRGHVQSAPGSSAVLCAGRRTEDHLWRWKKVDGCQRRRSYIRSCWCNQRCHLQGFCCQRKTYSLGAVVWHTCARQSKDLGFDMPYPCPSKQHLVQSTRWTGPHWPRSILPIAKSFCTLTLPIIGPRSAACYMMQLFIAKRSGLSVARSLGLPLSMCVWPLTKSPRERFWRSNLAHSTLTERGVF